MRMRMRTRAISYICGWADLRMRARRRQAKIDDVADHGLTTALGVRNLEQVCAARSVLQLQRC
jgi:hypothetical protein